VTATFVRSRRDRLLWCGAIALTATVLSLVAGHLDSFGLELAVDHGAVLAAIGVGPAVFVTLFTAGTFALAHAVGYKRRALWVTTALLFAYLGLKGIVWQRAYRLAATSQETLVIDGETVAAPPPGGVDGVILLTTTMGLLCLVRAAGDMRRAVLLPVRIRKAKPEREPEAGITPEGKGTPLEADARDVEAEEGPAEPETSLETLDEKLNVPLPPLPRHDLDAALPHLDAGLAAGGSDVPAPAATPTPAEEPVEPPRGGQKRRRRPVFE
jgi:hypothetical protein